MTIEKKDAPALDWSKLQRYPLSARRHKVGHEDFARPVVGATAPDGFLEGLPNILAAGDLKKIVAHMVAARAGGHRGVWALGGHVVKTGLAPVLIALMREGFITDLAVNGAFAIHDFEIARIGRTSEIVDDALDSGAFGFAEETGRDFNLALRRGLDTEGGYGDAVARWIAEANCPHVEQSVLAQARALGVRLTVHSGVGTEIIHQHPECDGAAIGELLMRDFRALTNTVADLSGGTWINLGSAVILPETLLKAISVANNLGRGPRDFVTVNMDMIRHYRPDQNVVKRPVKGRGHGYHLIGHHEIMVPLLAWLLLGQTP